MKQAKIENLKFLLVDDHMTVRMDIEKNLRDLGCKQIDQAPDVEHATDLMEKKRYDLVFVDLKMPGKSGYDLMLQCRKDKKWDSTAFIVISAESEEHYIISALSAGATSYIVKPVGEHIIREHVGKALKWIQQRTG